MSEVKFEFGAQDSGLLSELKKIREELAASKESCGQLRKEMADTFQQSIKGAAELDAQLQESLKTQAAQSEQIKQQSAFIRELKKEYDNLASSSTGAFDTKQAKAMAAEIQKLKAQLQQLTDELSNKKKKKVEIIPEGSIAEAKATITRIKAEIESLGTSARKSNVGKYLADELKIAEKELKVLEKEAGLTAEKSGNALTKGFSALRSIAYVLPGIGIAGILGALSDGLITLIKPLFESNKALVTQSEILADTKDKYSEAAANVTKLKLDVALAKDGFIDKNTVVKEYNDTMGKTAGAAKTLDDVEQSLAKNADAYIKFTLLKAAANVALGKAAEEAFNAELARNKTTEELITTGDKLLKFGVQNGSAAPGFVPGSNNFEQDKKNAEAFAKARGEARRKAEVDEAEKQKNNLEKIAEKFEKDAAEISKKFNFKFEPDQKDKKDKRVEAFKDRSSQILQLEKELSAARVAVITDGRDKEVAAEDARFAEVNAKANANIEQYLREADKVRASNKTAADKTKELKQLSQLIQLEDELVQQEKVTHVAKLLAIDIKYNQDAAKAFDEANKAINDIILKDQDKEINAVTEKYDKIFKAIETSRKKNIANSGGGFNEAAVNIVSDDQRLQAEEGKRKAILAITNKYDLKQNDEARKLADAQNDIIVQAGVSEAQLTYIKEVNKQNIIIKFAKERIEILKAAGTDENDLAIAQQVKLIQDAEKRLGDLTKGKGKGKVNTSLTEFLGIDPDGLKELQAALSTVGNTLSQFFGDLTAGVDAQIAQKQKLIDAINEQISAQEDAVAREKDLQAQGYANNYQLEQQKLADLKKQKEEEIRLQAEQQKKKEALQKAQIIADSVAQVSNLITASTEIFEALSGIPFIGVPLAIATIGVMFAGFAAAKVSAYQNVGKAKEGKRIAKGRSHNDGGNKYVSMDGNDQDILEIEKGEWVINKESSEKYNPLLEAINSKSISRMKGPQLVRMLEPMGIRLQHDVPQKIVQRYDAATGNNTVVVNNTGDQTELKRHGNLLEQLVENTSVHTEYFDGYRIEKRGNNIRKITTK